MTQPARTVVPAGADDPDGHEPAAPQLSEEIERGQDAQHPLRRRLAAFQAWSHRGSALRRVLVVGVVALTGGLLVLTGALMLITPGPGWLFVFLGIGVWSLEFSWAGRLNAWVLRQLRRAWDWWAATRLARWWSWCLSGAAQRTAAAQEAADAQRRGRPVRSGPRNARPGT